jgi:hypothetical protein
VPSAVIGGLGGTGAVPSAIGVRGEPFDMLAIIPALANKPTRPEINRIFTKRIFPPQKFMNVDLDCPNIRKAIACWKRSAGGSES